MNKVIKGRNNIIKEANEHIKLLASELENIIRGAEQEYLFHIIHLYPNIFASLARSITDEKDSRTYNITWLRATTGLTVALNKILPNHLPLKHLKVYNIKKFEKTFKENYFRFVLIALNIGKWQYILENESINRIKIKNGGPETFYSEDKVHAFAKYIGKVIDFSKSKEYNQWHEVVFKNLPEELVSDINSHLLENHGFTIKDLGGATLYLERIAEGNELYLHRNKLHAVFTKNIRSGRADKLFNALIFGKGKDLRRSPLIPVKGGYLLIAKWIFEFELLFDSWIRPILEQNYEKFADYAGRLFERHVRDRISNYIDVIRSNIVISEDKYPEIKTCLKEMGKKHEFELDLIVIKDDIAFIISCKGGRKELPRLFISRMWGEIPEKDIISRINKNKKDCKELDKIHECLKNNTKILEDLGLKDKTIVPGVVYSSPQPLSIPEIKEVVHAKFKAEIVTLKELEDLIKTKSIKTE